jgi:hypothetical protein
MQHVQHVALQIIREAQNLDKLGEMMANDATKWCQDVSSI